MAKAKRPPQTRKKLGGPRIGGDGPREAKAAAVADFQERLQSSSAVVLTEYRGMTVGELAELREALRDAAADYKVFKNTLASIAARNLGYDDLVGYFEGPTAFTFSSGDPVVVAKKLTDFAKRVPTLVVKGGILDGRVLSPADVTALSTLESREVMLAKIAGLFQSPLQQLANLISTPLNQLGSLLAQLRDKLPDGGATTGGGETSAAPEAAASETSADETPAESAEAPAAETLAAAEAPGGDEAPAETEAPAAEAAAAEQGDDSAQNTETTEG